MMYRPKHLAEYALLRMVGWWVNVLPYRMALASGWGLAWLGHYVFRFRVKEARARIRAVLGAACSERDVSRIAWRSFRNLAFSVVDVMRLPSLTRAFIDGHIEHQPVLSNLADVARPRGAVLALPHMGSWEMAGMACQVMGLPMFFVAGAQRNPLIDDYLNRLRSSKGVDVIINRSGALKSVVRKIRQRHILAILPDVRARTPGLRIRFLGGEADWGAGAAQFARHTGAPVVPVLVTREGWTRHRWTLYPPIRPDPSLDKIADGRRIMQQLADIFDAAIRARPDQYFWYNKRWVLDPLT
jgi:lauroyl/myristoyl acyltransferase